MKYKIIFFLLFPITAFPYNFSKILDLYNPIINREITLKVSTYKRNFREPLSVNNIPSNYLKNVMFWRDIYSYFDSKKILIHSKIDLSNVFKVVDLEDLYKREPNKIVAEIKKNKLIRKELEQVKKEISSCYNGKKCSLKINYDFSKKDLFKNLRTQTGQLDILKKGLNRFSIYKNTLYNIIQITNSDLDWLAIPFLESSFNSKAVSKVGATGAWQIMSYVGKKLMPINKYVDTRKNPIISAYAALKILRENRIITKNNDIAIISYNSGLRNFLKFKKNYKKRTFTTNEYLSLSKKKNKNFDFASENFLLEYYAMREFLIKEGVINKDNKRNISSTQKGYYPYISKCKTRPSRVIKLLERKNPKIKSFNNHFKRRYFKKVLPPGQIYISNIILPKKYYKKIEVKNLDDMSPNSWKANQSNCSII